MTQRKQYDEQTKAAVMAALLQGQSISYVADKYKIPEGTVKRWSAAAKSDLEPVRTQKRERIGELIVDNLEASLLATQAIANVVKDPKWIRQQTASELAILYGVIQDKTFRILEALPDESADESAVANVS